MLVKNKSIFTKILCKIATQSVCQDDLLHAKNFLKKNSWNFTHECVKSCLLLIHNKQYKIHIRHHNKKEVCIKIPDQGITVNNMAMFLQAMH